MSLQFEKDNPNEYQSTLLICICWIGHTFYFDKDNWHHETKQFINRHYGSIEPPNSNDSSLFQEWFAITNENLPICLLEYGDLLAAQKSTHVVSYNDFQDHVVTLTNEVDGKFGEE